MHQGPKHIRVIQGTAEQVLDELEAPSYQWCTRMSSIVNLYMRKLSWVEKEVPEEVAEEYWLLPQSHGVLMYTDTHTWISSSGRSIMLDTQMQRTRSKGIWGTRGIYGSWSWRVSSAPRVFITGLAGSWQDLEGQRKILKSRGSFVLST